jgi:hypothetical protein
MKRSYLAPTLFVSLALVAVACSEDGDDNPKPPDVGAAGSKTSAGSAGRAPATAGSSGNTGGAPEAGGGSTTTDAGEPPVVAGGGQGGSPAVECALPELGEDGCFNCPNQQLEYLNRCSDGDCLPFDNAQRLPLLKADGSLPDLPN